jgi:hypothetical protein
LLAITSFAQVEPVDITESTFKLSGLSSQEMYFGLATGDQIIVNFQELEGKEVKEIELSEYPKTSKFMEYRTTKITNKTLIINNTGVFVLKFKNSALSKRVCRIKIQRIPQSIDTRNFNTNVYWRTETNTTYADQVERYLVSKQYVPKKVVSLTEFYINSGSNSTFKGGKSRVTFPVLLPPNTVQWYYEFSTYRDANS